MERHTLPTRKYKEVFDAEVFAIRRALRILEERNEIGASYTVFADSKAATRRVAPDWLGLGQALKRAIIALAE